MVDQFISGSVEPEGDAYLVTGSHGHIGSYIVEELLTNWKELRKAAGKDLEHWPEDTGVVSWNYLSEKNACMGPLFIPRYLWHGCYNYTNEPAILIYHITNKYDGDDEDRLDPFIAGWPYERQVK